MQCSSGHDTGWLPRSLALISFLAWSMQATCCMADEVLPCFGDDGTQPLDNAVPTRGDARLGGRPLTLDA